MPVNALVQRLVSGSLGAFVLITLSSCNKAYLQGLSTKKENSPSSSDQEKSSSGYGQKSQSGNQTKNSDIATVKAVASEKDRLKLSGFLTSQDFRIPSNVAVTSDQDLAKQIPENGAFFPSGWLAKEGQECSEIAMDQNLDDASITIKDGIAVVDFAIDASVCDANYGPFRMAWQPGQGLLKVTCLADLTPYDGMPWGAVKTKLIAECENSGEGSVLYNAALVGVLDLTATGSPIPNQKLTVTVARMSPEDQGCSLKREGSNIIYGPCRNIIQVARENPGISSYSEVSYDQLMAPLGVNMFSSGKAQFMINGWQGSISYGAQGQNASWLATKAGAKAEGALQPGY